MIFGQDRHVLRNMYADAWKKRCVELPLSPLEAQIAAILDWDREYHQSVTGNGLDRDYLPEVGETNPFLHMGLHLGIREQVATNRPAGIAGIHRALLDATGDAHAAEHRMIDALAETLWESQSNHAPPDEKKYLQRLQALTR